MTNERLDYVSGLRQLADFIEAHADLPLPTGEQHSVYVCSKDALIAVARTPGIRWDNLMNHDESKYFALAVPFAGGHSYQVFTDRTEVCRRVVTGTRIEPAKPEQIVEVGHWECDEPLLVGAR